MTLRKPHLDIGRVTADAEKARAVTRSCDPKWMAKTAKQRRLVGEYTGWFARAAAAQDARVLGWQPHGALPVSVAMGRHYVNELPYALEGEGCDA